MSESPKKIGMVEMFFMLILVVAVDAIEAAAGAGMAIPVIGPALVMAGWVVGIIGTGIMTVWLYFKGVKLNRFFVGALVNFFPFLNIFPSLLIGLIATFVQIKAGEALHKEAPTNA
ncbi:MAG: hypothetical protein Q8R26_01420 [bacterium]|nr:hypothetical protein [bacterium]